MDVQGEQVPHERERKSSLIKKETKKKKKDKKRKKELIDNEGTSKKRKKETSGKATTKIGDKNRSMQKQHKNEPNIPDLRYILAPMVGASELAFRLLCRKYGATLAYTPMMDAQRFAHDLVYRKEIFQTTPQDRPLVCHFSANTPKDFADAAVACAPYCDAIDLNLGCPQKTAYVGHFGSYLLGNDDRALILDMIRASIKAVPALPVCVKIRLLDTFDETLELVTQLHEAGAAWIAVHARYRATWDRKGPGARDGPALLDQVAMLREKLPRSARIIANGNVINPDDIASNTALTKANGIMSAEGILDNPALFMLSQYSGDLDEVLTIPYPSSALIAQAQGGDNGNTEGAVNEVLQKKKRKQEKKLREIAKIEKRVTKGETLIEEQHEKLSKKSRIEASLQKILKSISGGGTNGKKVGKPSSTINITDIKATANATITLRELHETGGDKLQLANEYLRLVRCYPITVRTVVFHTRRMLRDELTKFQLLDDCIAAKSVQEVQTIVDLVKRYQDDPTQFLFDKEKAARQKEAVALRIHEEGKRKRYEERMKRKAKREGKDDLEFYLRQGAEVPTAEVKNRLRALSREDQLVEWKKNHSRHCMAYHLDACKRERTCGFLHVDSKGSNAFVEKEEIAG